MFKPVAAFSGFSVDSIDEAHKFYTGKLGLRAEEAMAGMLRIYLPDGAAVWVYEKPNHKPASYTMLNLVVKDIDEAVDELAGQGTSFERYEGMDQDDKAIARGKQSGRGPDIAWFKDPAGNILSVLQND